MSENTKFPPPPPRIRQKNNQHSAVFAFFYIIQPNSRHICRSNRYNANRCTIRHLGRSPPAALFQSSQRAKVRTQKLAQGVITWQRDFL